MPYTSLNGHMFSALHKDGTVALRLPEREREAFLKKTAELKSHFAASHAFVAAMKPKPATKKPATSKKTKPRGR